MVARHTVLQLVLQQVDELLHGLPTLVRLMARIMASLRLLAEAALTHSQLAPVHQHTAQQQHLALERQHGAEEALLRPDHPTMHRHQEEVMTTSQLHTVVRLHLRLRLRRRGMGTMLLLQQQPRKSQTRSLCVTIALMLPHHDMTLLRRLQVHPHLRRMEVDTMHRRRQQPREMGRDILTATKSSGHRKVSCIYELYSSKPSP